MQVGTSHLGGSGDICHVVKTKKNHSTPVQCWVALLHGVILLHYLFKPRCLVRVCLPPEGMYSPWQGRMASQGRPCSSRSVAPWYAPKTNQWLRALTSQPKPPNYAVSGVGNKLMPAMIVHEMNIRHGCRLPEGVTAEVIMMHNPACWHKHL